jgi:hypothetical protein
MIGYILFVHNLSVSVVKNYEIPGGIKMMLYGKVQKNEQLYGFQRNSDKLCRIS